MSKFLVIYTQGGEGCDYTIGCGVRTKVVEAEHRGAALKAAEYAAFGDGGFDGDECEIVSVQVVAMEHVIGLDCEYARQSRASAKQTREQANAAEQERREYERLRSKFGD